MPLIPGTSHIVRWTKQNLLDTTTYYPYAIIRDTRTMAILDQFALASITDARYSKAWNVVQDPTGQGRQIEVEVTIYEDAAHTSVSAMYGRWAETFLVLQWQPTQTGGSGGAQSATSAGIDYRMLADMVARRLLPAIEAIEMPGPGEVDISPLSEALGAISEQFAAHGKKLDVASDYSQKMAVMHGEITSALGRFRDTFTSELRQAAEDAVRSLDEAFNSGSANLSYAVDASKGSLSSHAESELAAVVEKFKAIMGEHASAMGSSLEGKLGELLDSLKLQRTTDSYSMTPKEPKIQEDTRGRRFLSYAQKR